MIITGIKVNTKKQVVMSWILSIISFSLFVFSVTFVALQYIFKNTWMSALAIIFPMLFLTDLGSVLIFRKLNRLIKLNYFTMNYVSLNTKFPEKSENQLHIIARLQECIPNQAFNVVEGSLGTGKTTAVIYFLEEMGTIENIWKDTRIDNIVFIDFDGNFDEINFRINEFAQMKGLIIIDNYELIEGTSLDEIISEFPKNRLLKIQNKPMKECKIENEFIEGIDPVTFINIYNKLSDNAKQLFIALSVMQKKSTFIDIVKLITRDSKFKKSLREITRTRLFYKFPNADQYYFCFYRNQLNYLLAYVNEEEGLSKLYEDITKNTSFSTEVRWLNLVHCNLNSALFETEQYKMPLFSGALKTGSYDFLYETLVDEIKKKPEKENMFLYELGTLAFHVNKQDSSYNYYHKLLEIQQDNYQAMIGIVESAHGSSNSKVIQYVNVLLDRLSAVEDDFYAFQYKYWETHINFEKGNFELIGYQTLLNQAKKLLANESLKQNPQSRYRIQEIIKRIYTESLRLSYIYGKRDKKLESEYVDHLKKTGSRSQYKYYLSSYIEGSSIHYNEIPIQRLRGETDDKLINNAIFSYEKALRSEYGETKSKWATKIKKAEVMLNKWNFSDHAISDIKLFIHNARDNKVDLHIAYGDCLYAKAQIIKEHFGLNDYPLTILECLAEARKIYLEYGNEYGVFRVDFLLNLYNLKIGQMTKSNFISIYGEENRYIFERELLIIKKIKKSNSIHEIMLCISSFCFVLQ